MGDKTGIEWTDATWNPVRGCTRVSEGCRNCYAERVAARFAGAGQPYEGLARMTKAGPRWTGRVRLVDAHLGDPLRWRKPRRVFVNSMSDLFHEALTDEAIDKVFAVMAMAPQHTFQVLTKRPERMRAYLRQVAAERDMQRWCNQAVEITQSPCAAHLIEERDWPLPNVWLGVSIEDQATADDRARLLLETPAALRFVSAEPLLGPVTLFDLDGPIDVPEGMPSPLHWVIAGGESGPGARPMHPDWARALRDQCAAAGVPFFFKQWGEWKPDRELEHGLCRGLLMRADGTTPTDQDVPSMMAGTFDFTGWQHFSAIGKKAAGALLDGCAHRAWPA